MIDRLLAAVAHALRGLIRLFITTRPAPGALHRGLLLLGFCPAFALWMAFRAVLLLCRRTVEVEAACDLGMDGVAGGRPPSWRVPCTLPDLIQTYLFLFGVWEPDVSAFIRSRLEPGDVYVDVGANIGAFVLLAAERTGRGGAVVAIEASQEMAGALGGVLEANVRSHRGLERVTVVVAAASDRPGELTLTEGPNHNRGRTTTVAGATPGMSGRPGGRVHAEPLGALLEPGELEETRLVKIDVEGAEPAVLRGLAPLLPRLRAEAEIMVECSPHWWAAAEGDLATVLQPYLDAGFRCYELENDYWPWRYVWSRKVSRPRRLREPLATVRRRVDLVLSRIDADSL